MLSSHVELIIQSLKIIPALFWRYTVDTDNPVRYIVIRRTNVVFTYFRDRLRASLTASLVPASGHEINDTSDSLKLLHTLLSQQPQTSSRCSLHRSRVFASDDVIQLVLQWSLSKRQDGNQDPQNRTLFDWLRHKIVLTTWQQNQDPSIKTFFWCQIKTLSFVGLLRWRWRHVRQRCLWTHRCHHIRSRQWTTTQDRRVLDHQIFLQSRWVTSAFYRLTKEKRQICWNDHENAAAKPIVERAIATHFSCCFSCELLEWCRWDERVLNSWLRKGSCTRFTSRYGEGLGSWFGTKKWVLTGGIVSRPVKTPEKSSGSCRPIRIHWWEQNWGSWFLSCRFDND